MGQVEGVQRELAARKTTAWALINDRKQVAVASDRPMKSLFQPTPVRGAPAASALGSTANVVSLDAAEEELLSSWTSDRGGDNLVSLISRQPDYQLAAAPRWVSGERFEAPRTGNASRGPRTSPPIWFGHRPRRGPHRRHVRACRTGRAKLSANPVVHVIPPTPPPALPATKGLVGGGS